MIKYDYQIQRLSEKRKFKPVPQYMDLQNYSIIRGNNAIGKSTLLHLIAYAFYGYDQRSFKGKYHQINETLRDKVTQFNDSDDQIVEFDLTIEDIKDGTKICSRRGEADDLPRIYEVDGTGKKIELNYERFAQRYCVIYDIPDKPTDRISKMVSDVKAINMDLMDRIDRFSEFLAKTNNDITDSHDPARIRRLEGLIEEIETTLDKLKAQKEEKENIIKLIDLLTFKDDLYEARQKIGELKKKLEALKSKKNQDRRDNRNRTAIITLIRSSYQEFHASMRRSLLESAQVKDIADSDHFTRFKSCFEDLTLKDWEWTDEVHDMLVEYKEFLENTYSKYSFNDKVASILEQLLNTLKELNRTGEKIPKFSIPKIMESVKEVVSKHELDKNTAESIKNSIKHTENATGHLADFVSNIEDFGEDSSAIYEEDEVEIVYDYTHSIKIVKDDIEKWVKRKDKLILQMEQNGIDANNEEILAHAIRTAYPAKFKHYVNKTSHELKRERETVNGDIDGLDIKKKVKETDLHVAKRDLERMKSKDVHPLFNCQDDIHKLYDKMIDIKRKVSDYNDYFDILQDHEKPLTDQIEFYNSCISKYFARKLGKIPYIKEQVEVKEVDYLNRRFILAGSDIAVKFDFFSTGQAQCIYLISMLNQNMDRKVILLLDEISSMDDKTKGLIYAEIKKQRDTGQLLVAILAEMSNDEPSVEVI